MLRLLNIEFQKLRHNRSARVITAVYFILISLMSLLASIKFNFGDFSFRLADQGIFNFPFIWHFNTWIAALLKMFLAIVIVSMMANEYTHRTLKQNLIDGLSKREFVLSKFLTVVVYAGISTVFIFLVSLILGLVFSDYTEFGIIVRDLEYVLAYFLKLVAFFSFCLFLGVMVKRSAFALGFLLIWWIIEWAVYGTLVSKLPDNSDLPAQITQFFPLMSMQNLIIEPFTRFNAVQSAATQLGAEFTKTYNVTLIKIAIVSVWTFLFNYWSLQILKKRDL